MGDLDEIYREVILSHNKRPRNARVLEHPTGTAKGHNPLCGDLVTVFLKLNDAGVIEDITFQAQACAICTASASLMTLDLKGKTLAEAKQRLQAMVGLLKGAPDEPVDLETWGDAAALAGVRKFPVRIKCATLPWHTFEEAVPGGLKG